MQQANTSLTSTIVGLGTGTGLCQYRANDQVNMVEIDPQVINIARNTSLFTYMRDCLPKTKLLNEDGRRAVNSLNKASQNVIVLDAFSSDAVPIHLMTLEAFTIYKQKLAPNGIILVNLSNRYLNLLPVVNSLGRSLNMMVFYNNHKGDAGQKQFDSQWALLTQNEQLLPSLTKLGWRFLASNEQLLWTDNYSNIIPLLRWR
jgi:spermidine synthase